jgi:hypothetical protein
MTSKRALLVARVGDESLHPAWIRGQAYRERVFDLHLSYFGDREEPFGAMLGETTLSFEKGGKWDGLHACLSKLGAKLSAYEWICLPDDDLWADAPTWSRFFDLLDVLKPRIAQPALKGNSFYSHDITLQRKGCAARWTNFVEVMCPAFKRDALLPALEMIASYKTGWGLDYVWQRQAQGSQRALAIIDATPVLHTRAVRSGSLYKHATDDGPEAEMERLAPAHSRQRPRAYHAVDDAGRPISYFGLNRRLIAPRHLSKERKRHAVKMVHPDLLKQTIYDQPY